MAIEGNQYQEGIFVNPDAIDARERKWLAKLLGSILEKSSEESIVPKLLVPNQLTPEMGTEGKFYDWGQLVARFKPDGVSTDVQKIKPSSTAYSLDEYEVKVGITDRAKINSQMQAQDMLTAGDFGRAFARAFDAQGLETIRDDLPTTSGTDWSAETDANILDQLTALFDNIWNAGFKPKAVAMTQAQQTRIARIGLGYATPITVPELFDKQWNIGELHIWRKIDYKEPDGSSTTMFDPTGHLAVIDIDACGVFSQRPTTIEKVRDAFAGVDFAILRKYFKSDLVQLDGGAVLDSLVI